jgi:hypothetical protein
MVTLGVAESIEVARRTINRAAGALRAARTLFPQRTTINLSDEEDDTEFEALLRCEEQLDELKYEPLVPYNGEFKNPGDSDDDLDDVSQARNDWEEAPLRHLDEPEPVSDDRSWLVGIVPSHYLDLDWIMSQVSSGSSQSASSQPPPRRLATEENTDPCAICLEGDTQDNPLRSLKCGHRFHLQCIEQAKSRSNQCPVCRQLIQLEKLK